MVIGTKHQKPIMVRRSELNEKDLTDTIRDHLPELGNLWYDMLFPKAVYESGSCSLRHLLFVLIDLDHT